MNQEPVIIQIAHRLNDLNSKIKSYTHSATVLEGICHSFFDALFGWKLRNLNQRKENFPGVDLGDAVNGIAIQITAQDRAEKGAHTLDKIDTAGLRSTYGCFICFFLVPGTPTGRTSDPEDFHRWGINEFIERILEPLHVPDWLEPYVPETHHRLLLTRLKQALAVLEEALDYFQQAGNKPSLKTPNEEESEPNDDLLENHKTVLSMAEAEYFHPKNRLFVQWCRSIAGVADEQDRIPNASQEIKQVLAALDSPSGKKKYSAEKRALARWMSGLSRDLGKGKSSPSKYPKGVLEDEARDIQHELKESQRIKVGPDGKVLMGSALLHNRRFEVKVLLSTKVCEEPKEASVYVDELTSSALSGVLYPHPAFALAVTSEQRALSEGMDAVVATALKLGAFKNSAFRWALMEYPFIERLKEGDQISAAALVAACLLKAHSKEYAGMIKSLEGVTIWVQVRTKTEKERLSFESSGPQMGYVFKAVKTAVEKQGGKHIILAASGESTACIMTENVIPKNVKIVYLDQDCTSSEHICNTISQAMKEKLETTEKASADKSSAFIGRRAELGKLKSAITRGTTKAVSICSIKGMGGVGKTELAKQLVIELQKEDRGQDNLPAIWIDLEGHKKVSKSVDTALHELCGRGLGFPDAKFKELNERAKVEADKRGFSEDEQYKMYLEELTGAYLLYLEKNQRIVVLDNAKDNEQMEGLLPSIGYNGKSLFIVTSRHVLKHQLFSEGNSQDLTSMNLEEVQEWVTRYGAAAGLKGHEKELWEATKGLPLAISIVIECWRLSQTTVSDFFENLKKTRLDREISSEARRDGTPVDYTSLRTCFAFSINLLDQHSVKKHFLMLSVFGEGRRFDAPSVAAVCGFQHDDPEIACREAWHLIVTLLGASLIEVDQQDINRYWLHDLIQEYASQELPKSDMALAESRLSYHFAGVTAHYGKLFRQGGLTALRSSRMFQQDENNLEFGREVALGLLKIAPQPDRRQFAAIAVCYAAMAARVCDLSQPAMKRKEWLQHAVQCASEHLPENQRLIARLMVAEGLALRHLNETPASIARMVDAIRIFESLEMADHLGISDACGNWGNLLTDLATKHRAGRGYKEMNAEQKDAFGLWIEEWAALPTLLLNELGGAALTFSGANHLSVYEQMYRWAEQLHLRAYQISKDFDAKKPDRGIGQDLGNLAIVHAEYARIAKIRGDEKTKDREYKKAEGMFKERNQSADRDAVRDMRGRANGLGNLGNQYCSLNRFDDAMECQQEALELHKQAGNKRGEAATYGNIAVIFYNRRHEGDLATGNAWNLKSKELFDKEGDAAGVKKCSTNESKSSEWKSGNEPLADFHLADRYGKIHDAEIADFTGVDMSDVIRSLELCAAWEQVLHPSPRNS
jgi:tetratricopeptide (TPR) repeat protein